MHVTITYSDLGHPTQPGEYPFGDARVEVGKQHLETWAVTPTTCFTTIMLTRVGDTVARFALGGPAKS